jgi:Prp8 binding protein
MPSIFQNLLRCSWSPDGTKVSAGSADRFVYIWDTTSRRIIYKLPGHNGSVNDVVFHPKEPIGNLCRTCNHELQLTSYFFNENIVASGASDKLIYLGEIDS